MVDKNPEWNEVRLCSTVLVRVVHVSEWFMGNEEVVVWILPRGVLMLRILTLGSLFRGAIGRTPSHLFDLHVLLRPDKNVPHLGDIILRHMLVERVGDLQATDPVLNIGRYGRDIVRYLLFCLLPIRYEEIVRHIVCSKKRPIFEISAEKLLDIGR